MELDGYIRVSDVAGREGPSFQSPDQQREKIEAWSKMSGATIAEWHTDLDRSGGTLDRPGFNRMMERVRARETGGVVVARIDRFSRAGVADALRAVEDIHEAGGVIAALDLGIDPMTPFGEFAMTLMLGLARMERRRITDGWLLSQRRAIARGVHLRAPVGYRRGPDGLVPDESADAIRELFRLRAQGAGYAELIEYATTAAPRPEGTGPWTASRLGEMFRRRTYLGVAQHGEYVNEDAHEPLVSRGEWLLAQPTVRGQNSGAEGPLAGLVRCAGCRYSMTRKLRRADGVPHWSCRKNHTPGTCSAPASMTEARILAVVEGAFMERHGEEGFRAERENSGLAAARAVLDATEAELSAFAADTRVRGLLGEDAWQNAVTVRAEEVDAARAAVNDETLPAEETPAEYTYAGIWPTLSDEERSGVLNEAIDAVFLRRGHGSIPTAERVAICWTGEAPSDLPRRVGGYLVRAAAIRPFDWPEAVAGVPSL